MRCFAAQPIQCCQPFGPCPRSGDNVDSKPDQSRCETACTSGGQPLAYACKFAIMYISCCHVLCCAVLLSVRCTSACFRSLFCASGNIVRTCLLLKSPCSYLYLYISEQLPVHHTTYKASPHNVGTFLIRPLHVHTSPALILSEVLSHISK